MTSGRDCPRPLRFALWVLIALPCAVQAFEIRNRGIDPDELEHLHAAYSVWSGEVPYRDFFEHHGPALYYALLPLFAFCGPQLAVLWLARLAMWCCALVTLWLAGKLARRWSGDRAALLAMCLLAWTTVFHGKGIELRPDVPAMLLILIAVGQFNYATGGGSWQRFFYVGLLAGLAMLFTQKCAVPAAAMALAACLARLVTRSPEAESAGTVAARVAVPMAAGIAAVWGIAGLAFAIAGATTDFWNSTWLLLWIWPIRSNAWQTLRATVSGDLTVWAAALIEIVCVLRTLRRREPWHDQRRVVAIVAGVCIVSLACVKATYAQFYLLWMPLMAALAARRIALWCDRPLVGVRLAAASALALALLMAELFLWQRTFINGESGALPNLAQFSRVVAVASTGAALGLALIALASARKNWQLFVLIFAGLGMGYGGLRDADRAAWSNGAQVAAINEVNRKVAPDGRILDGFTGWGALRPHAWYYWWINEYSLALIPKRERREGLVELLEQLPPAAVLFDRNLELLPREPLDWIRAHYEPDRPKPLWLLRADKQEAPE